MKRSVNVIIQEIFAIIMLLVSDTSLVKMNRWNKLILAQTGPTTPTTSGTTPSGDEPDCTGTGADPIFYPYPSDCTKYYECANGDLYVEDCPEGLWWHVEVNQCDYPGDYCVDSSV
jgi:hypothetical protein